MQTPGRQGTWSCLKLEVQHSRGSEISFTLVVFSDLIEILEIVSSRRRLQWWNTRILLFISSPSKAVRIEAFLKAEDRQLRTMTLIPSSRRLPRLEFGEDSALAMLRCLEVYFMLKLQIHFLPVRKDFDLVPLSCLAQIWAGLMIRLSELESRREQLSNTPLLPGGGCI